MNAYLSFINQIETFLRRFYMNRMWKGLFVLLSVLLFVFFFFSTLEYLAFLSVPVRRFLFWSFVFLFLFGFFFCLLYPFGQSRGWFRRMSYKEAAHYLAARYPELDDRLYNVLELSERQQEETSVLLAAAIEQISSRFISYRFEKQVRFVSNFKYLAVLLLFLLFGLMLYRINPRILASSRRIVHYEQEFEREFPFSVNLLNPVLRVSYEEDFKLDISVEGDYLPAELHIEEGGRKLLCKKTSPGRFSHTFSKVQRRIPFRITSGRYRSVEYVLEVDYKPLISDMKVVLHYPAYTGKKTEMIDNTLNLSIPEGTRIAWDLRIDNARRLQAVFVSHKADFGNEIIPQTFVEAHAEKSRFNFARQVFSACDYWLLPEAFSDLKIDTLSFTIDVTPDAYPRIEVLQSFDSLHVSRRYFWGHISDDYGFHSLIFYLRCTNANTGNERTRMDTLLNAVSGTDREFTYYLDWNDFTLEPGDEVSYGFVVRDNDVFYPYKAVYSPEFSYKKMSQEEMREEVARSSESVNEGFSLSLRSAQTFGKELKDMLRDMLSKKQLGWQDLKKVELMMEQQQHLREEYKELQEEIQRKQALEEELGKGDEELKEKQRQLQELMRQLLDDATMKKLEELQKLMQQNAPQEKIMDALEEVRRQQEQMNFDLERNMELYLRMEFENKLQQAVSEAAELREKSREITEKMNRKQLSSTPTDSLLQDQKNLEEGRERLKETLKNVDDLNQRLEKSTSFNLPDSLLETVRKSIEKTEENLKEENKKDAVRTQQETDAALQDLSDNLSAQMERIEEEDAAEDADFIRLLLKSIVRVSVQQEDLMGEIEKTRLNDPRYTDLIRRQSALNTEICFVADSIRAISRRQPQVALTTQKEVKNILSYSRESLDLLLGMNNVYYRNYNMINSRALSRQQYTMTSLNNLALLLSESLDKMQQKMNMKGKGSSKKKKKGQPQMSCPTQGKNNSSMPIPSMESMSKQQKQSLQQMQQDLNRRIEELKKMLQQMQGQQNPQQNPQGKSVKSGQTGNSMGSEVLQEKVSESFARAAAQQEMIRRMVQEKLKEERTSGSQAVGLYNSVLGEMEQTEKDLVNRVLNDRLLSRQKNIETRLLEAENAELKREKDERRESKEGGAYAPFQNDSIEMMIKKNTVGKDLLRFAYPELRPYYKKKVQDFFFKQMEK